MNYLLGVDLGTSAAKVLLIEEGGKILFSKSYAYPLYQPKNGWAEQNPRDWERAALTAIKEAVETAGVPKEDIRGIGLSGQMHGLVMLDQENQLLGNSIIWCDQRTERQTEEFLELMPLEKWLEITANPPLAGWTAAKILWVRENEPEKYAKCRHILLPKDYVRFILTGKFAMDMSDASGTQLMDVKNRRWSEEILEKLQIPKSFLGELYESCETVGTLLPEIAQYCGLSENTAVVAGGSDNACAAVGTGIVKEGQAFTSVGTSAIIYTHLDNFKQVPGGGLHLCCSAVPGCWHTMGGPQSAGLSLEWFKENFCQDIQKQAKESGKNFYEAVTEKAAQLPPGSDGLIYLPFLMGERTPHMNPWYRGGFIGLNTVHTQEHLLRAIMEGVAYCLADCQEILEKMGVKVVSMRACGGGSKNWLWREILAALYQCDMYTLEQEEGPAFGAAILAGVGAGVFPTVEQACERLIKEKECTRYDREMALKYEKYHKVYDKLYTALAEGMYELSRCSKEDAYGL